MQGWERPVWFAPAGVEAVTEYSFARQNWFDYAQTEQRAARQGVGLLDYSMLGKLLVEGADAEAFLQRICSQNMAISNSQVTYTLLLNARGGVESDVTVARFADDQYMLMSSMARTRRDHLHLQKHVQANEDVRLRDVTTAYGVLSLVGPHSRELLSRVSDADFSNQAFPFQTWQSFYLGHAPVWAQRLSFTGELGWEIFVTPDFAEHVMEQLLQYGKDLNLQLIGSEALNALRIEKGFLHWGHDMSYTEAPHQLGLSFLCNKSQDFIGKQAAAERKQAALGPYLCSVKLLDPQPLLYHNEPILQDGKPVGFITSGAWGASLSSAIGLAMVDLPRGQIDLDKTTFEVLVEGVAYPAQLSWGPLYDAGNTRCKS